MHIESKNKLQRSVEYLKKVLSREFPGGPVDRTPYFHCKGMGSTPDWGTQIPQTASPQNPNKQDTKQ